MPTSTVDTSPLNKLPYFEDLEVGMVFRAPGVTLTSGHAALHQAILGDRLRLPLDAPLAAAVTGGAAPLAHPGLVCDVGIGQSTLPTQRVIGNLFYRGLALRRLPAIGDTLRTDTEVVALRQNSSKEGRPATGLAALRISTVDAEGRPVLDFHRCAMLPLRDRDGATGRADDLEGIGSEMSSEALAEPIAGWDLDAFRAAAPGPHFADMPASGRWELEGGDVVSCAPELARLTTNIALAHHDAAAGGRGRRLVYGGHTIGIAAASLTRALPNLLTILGWHSCDHTGPVFEGDTLRGDLELESTESLPSGGGLLHLRMRMRAERGGGDVDEVLDWRLVAAMA
ncbi:MAG: MaoC family dehydratase [Solirubrobacterales bacterium]